MFRQRPDVRGASAPELRDIRIGGLRYPRATFVQTQDARQLEVITPDFIGWVGHDASATRELELDYKPPRGRLSHMQAARNPI